MITITATVGWYGSSIWLFHLFTITHVGRYRDNALAQYPGVESP